MSLNVLDIVLALGLAWAAFRGWQTGVVRSVIGLAGLLVAYFAGLYAGPEVGDRFIDDGALSAVVGIVLVFAAVLVLFHLAGRMVHAFLHGTALGVVDGVCGGALGLVKAVLVFGLLLILAHAYPLHRGVPGWIDGSRLAPPVQSASLVLIDGMRRLAPGVTRILDDAELAPPRRRPPVVDTLTRGAGEARKKIEALVEDSKKRLEQTQR